LSRKKGFTLVETLFSAVIITLVVVGILAVFAQTVDISRRIDYEYTAANLAKKQLESVRSIIKTSGFDSIISAEAPEERIDADGDTDSDGEYTRATSVTTSYKGDISLTEVEVEVHYYYREVKTGQPITMTTVFAKIEL